MKRISLSSEQVLGLLDEVIDERGEHFVYTMPRWTYEYVSEDEFGDEVEVMGEGQGCVYFDPNTGVPSCIVGCLLSKVGVVPEDMRNDDNTEAAVGAFFEGGDEEADYHSLVLESDEQGRTALLVAQRFQDAGRPYGVVRSAIRWFLTHPEENIITWVGDEVTRWTPPEEGDDR